MTLKEYLKKKKDKKVKVHFFRIGKDYGDPAWPIKEGVLSWKFDHSEKMNSNDVPKQGSKAYGGTVDKVELGDLRQVKVYIS